MAMGQLLIAHPEGGQISQEGVHQNYLKKTG